MDTVPGSLVYSATPSIHDTILEISVRSEETCRTSVFASYREVEQTTRVIDKDCGTPGSPGRSCDIHPGTWAVTGAIAVGLGALIYAYGAGADEVAMQPTTGEKASPEDLRSAGLIVGAFGLPLLAIAVIDGLRLRDTAKDLGEVEQEPDVTTASCHDRPIAAKQRIGEVLPFWNSVAPHDKAPGLADQVLHVAHAIDDAQLGAALVEPIKIEQATPKLATRWVDLLARYGLTWCA